MGDLVPAYMTGAEPDQRRFVLAYDGDVDATAERLGIDLSWARYWARQDWFSDALNKREQRELKALARENIYQLGQAIVPRLEIQSFWSDVMTNTMNKVADRLKASELLAKSKGLLLDKVVHEGNPLKPIEIRKCDLDDRIRLLLGTPIDVTPEITEETPHDFLEDEFVDQQAVEPDAGGQSEAVRGSVSGDGQPGESASAVQGGSVLPPADWL